MKEVWPHPILIDMGAEGDLDYDISMTDGGMKQKKDQAIVPSRAMWLN